MGLEKDLSEEHSNLIEMLEALVQFQLNCENDPNIPSSRGRRPKEKKDLTHSRVREKKNRLFYWDLQKSEVGHSEKYHEQKKI
jgi:hypothetical protein